MEHGLPFSLAFISVYIGIVVSDLFVYALGRIAQKSAWLRTKIIGRRVEQTRSWLETNLMRTVAMCRLTPGLLFPTFVACGWFKLSVTRFATASMLSAVIYTPIALAVATIFGKNVLQHFGYWAWVVLFVLALVLTLRGALRTSWRKQPPRRLHTQTLELLHKHRQGTRRHHLGMPLLAKLARQVSHAEYIPSVVFYTPLVLHWLLLALRYRSLSLPTIANPCIETGGFWGESKDSCLRLVGEEHYHWVAPFVTIDKSNADATIDVTVALNKIADAGLVFPIVAKPNIGWQGYGVQLLADHEQLYEYISAYPQGERILFQHAVPYDGEAGVFYARLPGETEGKVFSLTLRYFPYVVGDGHSTLKELIQQHPRAGWKARYHLGTRPEHLGLGEQELLRIPAEAELARLAFIGSIRIGGLYRDARSLITSAMSNRFDAIARSMPEFYFGRFDVCFKSIERLQAGEDFSIIEINGAGSEAIHVWDPELPLTTMYRELFDAQSRMFAIAARNRARGIKPVGLQTFFKALVRQHRLIKSYPPSG